MSDPVPAINAIKRIRRRRQRRPRRLRRLPAPLVTSLLQTLMSAGVMPLGVGLGLR
jgi:hypothetical protein